MVSMTYVTNDERQCLGLQTLVLKRFLAKDPQIDTYQPVDPLLKRYARDPHNKMIVIVLTVILNHFSFKDPQFDI